MSGCRWARLGALSLAIAAVVTHASLTAEGNQMEVRGLALVLDHIFTLTTAVVLLSVCGAVGRICLGRISDPGLGAIETLAYSTAIGMGVVATSILILGYTLGFSPFGLWVLLSGFAVLARHHLAATPGLVGRALRELGPGATGHRLLLLSSSLLFFGVAAFLLIVALAPPIDFDALMYHLHIPARWLERGAPFLPEDNMHAAYVGLVHMLYLPLISAGAPAGPAVLSAILALLLGLTAYSTCRQLFGIASGALAISLLWGNAIIFLVAVTPKVDVTLALFLLLAHATLISAFRREGSPGWAIGVSGALLGFAFGVKHLALPYGFALLPTLVFAIRTSRSGRSGRLRLFALFLASAVATSLPWVIKNLALFGTPLYPLLSDLQLEPWLQNLYGSRHLPASVSADSLDVLRHVREPFNLRDFVLSPGRLTPEVEARLYFPSPAVLLFPLALLVRNRMAIGFAVVGMLYLAAVLWVSSHINLRYLIPALPVLTIATAGALASPVDRPTRTRSAALFALIVLSLPAAFFAVRMRVVTTRAAPLAFGAISRSDYLLLNRSMVQWNYFQIVARVNRRLNSDSKLLMLFEARGLYFAVPVIQDNIFTNWELVAPLVDSTDCLRATGVTHVLVNTGTLENLVSRGLRLNMIQWSKFREFADSCLEPMDSVPGYELYRLRSTRHRTKTAHPMGQAPGTPVDLRILSATHEKLGLE